MKTELYLLACGMVEAFGLNASDYENRLTEKYLSCESLEKVQDLCDDILVDAAEKMMKETGFNLSVNGKGWARSLILTNPDNANVVASELNSKMFQVCEVLDPGHDFPDLHPSETPLFHACFDGTVCFW